MQRNAPPLSSPAVVVVSKQGITPLYSDRAPTCQNYSLLARQYVNISNQTVLFRCGVNLKILRLILALKI